MLADSLLPLTGGLLVGAAYAASIPLSVSKAETFSAATSKNAYRMAVYSLVRFGLSAGVLVGLGYASQSLLANNVVQTGRATLAFVVGMAGFWLVYSRRPKP